MSLLAKVRRSAAIHFVSGSGPARSDVGALIVGGDYQGLGIVRSLGQRGFPVCVVDDEQSIARFSRYTTRALKVADLRDQRKVVASLLELGNKFNLKGWVLFPTRDEHVATFSANRQELSKLFRVPTAPWDSIKWAWDKRNTYRLARKLGIPTPKTFCPKDIVRLGETSFPSPFVVKPAIKEHFFYLTKAKAWKANSFEELKERFRKASELIDQREILVQEWIPGGGTQQFSYCAFFRDDKAVGSMVVRRRRQHPIEFGRASTFVETIDLPVLEELSQRFLRAIHYYGLVELEYKLDNRDSQYKLLDVNARTWGYHSLGARAGVDFSYMLYADQVGMPVTSCRGQSGIAWVRMITDLPVFLVQALAGDANLRTYVKSLRSCGVEAVLNSSDPLPFAAEMLLTPYLAARKGF